MEEINVKAIEFVTEDTENIVRKKAKPNFKTIGKKFGKMTQQVADAIKNLDNSKINEIESNGSINLTLYESDTIIELNDIEIYSEDIEGWLVASEAGITVALDTQLDDELIKEGIAREFINRVQNYRKTINFEVTDRININFSAGEQLKQAIEELADYIKNETLTENLLYVPNLSGVELELDGEIVILNVALA
jgi:isoleucyl-tRNA synthetase